MKNEGHRPPDNSEVSRALPFYALRSLAASQPPRFARYYEMFGSWLENKFIFEDGWMIFESWQISS